MKNTEISWCDHTFNSWTGCAKVCAKDMSYGQHVKPPARPRVFCASLADWLDDAVPIEWLAVGRL